MVAVMIQAMPFHGHVAPLAEVARAFISAGHDVRAYTGSAHADAFQRVGAEVVRWRAAPDFDEHDVAATFPRLVGRKGPAQMLRNVEDLFVRTADGQVQDLLAEYAERPWDVIVADELSLGAGLASELTGTHWATVAITPLALQSRDLPPIGIGLRPGRGPLGRTRDAALRRIVPRLTAALQRAYDEQRRGLGLPPGVRAFAEAGFSTELVCATGVPELDWPRSDLPDSVAWVGALAPAGASGLALPPWWDELVADPRPIALVTQGTQNTDPDDLVAPAFAALGRQDVQVVATTGRADAAGFPFAAPPNARVAPVVPFGDLLPRTDVVVTNGGWGGVLAALAHGLPVVVAGGDLDKPEVAARVRAAGAGISLGTGQPTPRQVLGAWRRVRDDPGYRDAARRIAARLAEHDGPAEVVEHVARLAETPQPSERR
ncbi:glycosyltransferase [Agromyces mariniharenae]|uniref:Glycosyltransferase n=1 Tax=Agromyces mariniharenae TaxID=2604423 RepID=A0A5S4UZ44_9MICO|nr:nucleotide disphospho-sugar-binding domain-containing protein [Agromyces mariniharenae]TYL50783.1 glycosyltransferase [Agromyces mariniharenae]